jgi:futalosine hydrolase
LIVVTATAMEMRAAFSARVASIPKAGEHLRLEAGSKSPVVLLVTGIGVVNASMALGHLLGGLVKPRLVKPLGVLSLGVAGAFDLDELPLGQAVVIQAEIWPEYGLLTEEGIDPQGLGLALGKIDGCPVWDRISLDPDQQAQRLGLILPDMPQVLSLTVSGVTGTAQRAAFLRFRYNAAIENMEGFALAWTCARLKIPFLEVRTISNLVGSRQAEHWDLPKALARLGEVVKTILPEI